MKPLTHPVHLSVIVDALGGRLVGDSHAEISIIASLEKALAGSITFLANAKYAQALGTTQASAVILRAEHAQGYKGNAIITEDPYLYFAGLTQWWKKQAQNQLAIRTEHISPAASIHPSATIAPTAVIAAGAVVDAGAHVGEHVHVGAQSYIGADVIIGAHSYIAPHVTILQGCQLGQRAIINSGTVIGGDGFGFAPSPNSERQWTKIEQLGAVVIGDDVEIGSNTCVDRGAIDDTVIGNGVKLDNVIQIGHNVHVGDDTLIAACTGISGSTHIGKRCIIGGAVGMAGHIEVVDDVMVMAATNVTKSINKAGQYSGIIPFDEAHAWRKNAALLRHLSTMRDRIRELEKQVSHLTLNQKELGND